MADVFLDVFKGKGSDIFVHMCKELAELLRKNRFTSTELYFVYHRRGNDARTCTWKYLDRNVATMKNNSRNFTTELDRCFDLEMWPGESLDNSSPSGARLIASQIYHAIKRYLDHYYTVDSQRSKDRRVTYQ